MDVDILRSCLYMCCEEFVEGEMLVLLKLLYINRCSVVVFLLVLRELDR